MLFISSHMSHTASGAETVVSHFLRCPVSWKLLWCLSCLFITCLKGEASGSFVHLQIGLAECLKNRVQVKVQYLAGVIFYPLSTSQILSYLLIWGSAPFIFWRYIQWCLKWRVCFPNLYLFCGNWSRWCTFITNIIMYHSAVQQARTYT